MKKVLVIGDDSYIGTSFYEFSKDKFDIRLVSSRGGAWKDVDFNGYDSVLHCAGIAHVSRKKPEMEGLYYEINCDLAVAVAEKAKREDVKQFIFISSFSIYDNKVAEITPETQPKPNDYYGKSKLKAERELSKLAGDKFLLCIVRQPMVYGKGCKGNFPKLVKMVRVLPIFPDIVNKRSMIYIDNACRFYDLLIEKEKEGIFYPQNIEYVSTAALVKNIASNCGKRIILMRVFNPVIRLLWNVVPSLNKLFGDLYCVRQGDEDDYNIVTFEDSIKRSVYEEGR